MQCSELIFVPSLNKDKRCVKDVYHIGRHSPDLTGEKIGNVKIVSLKGSKRYPCGTTQLMWWVERDGRKSAVQSSTLIQGKYKGFRMHHGYTGAGKKGKNRPEWNTVSGHYYKIFRSGRKCYQEMPFFDDWNPDKGGDFWRGAKWIIDNLGERPSPLWTMDVIDHATGFVPGNLRWASHKTQERNKQHKWLGDISDDEFAVEAYRRGYVKRDGN